MVLEFIDTGVPMTPLHCFTWDQHTCSPFHQLHGAKRRSSSPFISSFSYSLMFADMHQLFLKIVQTNPVHNRFIFRFSIKMKLMTQLMN